MYPSPFGLNRRPFSSTPDPACVVPVGGMPEAITELELCAQGGQGIGILTAPAGLGKTVLCRKLADDLRDQLAVVFLPNANFPTRRSLLQALLYEMGHPYLRLGEQELRLEFTAAVRDLTPDRAGLVIIVDEAHLLHNRLLEELRTATHLVENGEMLVRLILSGQLELEERLVKKDLAAINQRIVSHCTLASLSMLESAEYLEQRIEWAGGTLSEIFEPAAVRMICQASDGNPRCLNQLADHSLLLGATGNQALITTTHVLEALEGLKQLPLQWNHVAVPQALEGNRPQAVEIIRNPARSEESDEREPQTACFEWGAPEEEPAETDELITLETADLREAICEDSVEDTEVEISWDAEFLPDLDDSLIDEMKQIIYEEDLAEMLCSESLAEAEELFLETPAQTAGADIWAVPEQVYLEEVTVEDHYTQLAKGIILDSANREPRDWKTWNPEGELRAEEESFAVPLPSSVMPEFTVIHDLPLPGEEWQPEDLKPGRRKPIASDPSELIEHVLPLIEAALSHEGRAIACDPTIAATLEDMGDSADFILDTLLANVSGIIEPSSTKDLDSLPILVDYLQSWPSNAELGPSREFYLQTGSVDLETRIAQTVLDTYTDLEPLMWNSTTQSEQETHLEAPPRVAGEEPIRDPGDSTPFEELRGDLRKALESSQPINLDPEEIETKREIRQEAKIEYDIVMPEPDEEPPAPRPISRTDAPNTGENENHPPRRAYQNLFSDLRQKKQA